MRRLSSSSWESRPVTPIDSTASEMMMAMITTTTRISTSVKPLLRMLRQRRAARLFLIESCGADVRIVAVTARLAVAPIRGDLVLTAVAAGTRVQVHIAPRVLGKGLQIPTRRIVGDGGVRRLFDQRLQTLFSGGIFEVVQTVQVQGRLNGPN